ERVGTDHDRRARHPRHVRVLLHAASPDDGRHAGRRRRLTRQRAVSLRTAIATPDGKRRYVRRLFATIAPRYDLITRVLSYGLDVRWKRRLIRLAALEAGDRVLDLACGTGDLALEAAPRVRLA